MSDASADERASLDEAAAAAVVAERYARFARDEAGGRSEVYEEWAYGIAADAGAQDILARIPAQRRQPPLVFAVARTLGAPIGPYAGLAAWLRVHGDELALETARRSLQTNEPLRCAALLPALAGIAGPIALLEVGASAGLCLFPDHYTYVYDGTSGSVRLDPAEGPSPVTLACDLRGAKLPPLRAPEIVWRAGIDLNPLDATDAADRTYLASLAWPGEHGRVERIAAALDVVAAHPPLIVRGDATDPDLLRSVAAGAPAGATLVITTPGVLPHIRRADRERLIHTVRDLDAVWVSIDTPGLVEAARPSESPAPGFILRRDGVALAFCDPLGAWLEWHTGDAGASALP